MMISTRIPFLVSSRQSPLLLSSSSFAIRRIATISSTLRNNNNHNRSQTATVAAARRSHSSRTTSPLMSSQSLSSQSLRAQAPPPALRKVLIANRGEIACRVIRTCQQWGIPTVAIYSSADGPNALHCQMANEAYCVGTGPAATESYLQMHAILDIAQQTGVDAIHPGYGFLSENATFCEAISSRKMTLIGPPASAMMAMASKSQSKAIMDAAGVPTTPGYYSSNNVDDDQDPQHLYHQAVSHVGFPLLIKAVAGGGGRGMRLVERSTDFMAALESCRSESLASFGDDRVLLERYLRRPRHIEVQIIADTHGNCVHLFERDCSLQRRHQKVMEEAPASDLPWALREHMGEMAKRAATAVGYVNAGTVEFLLDTQQTSSSDNNNNNDHHPFYFCEMNTRLQVEHPITEMITGIDLVEWQLRVAAGEVLPMVNQSDIVAKGHAFEARIYAEYPERNFSPATGTVWYHRPPVPINRGAISTSTTTMTAGTTTPVRNSGTPTTAIRADSSVQVGHQVSVYYDSMMSKLITYGSNRNEALQCLVSALKSYQIAGIPTNIEFLIRCAQHPTFQKAGAVTTAFLEDHADDVHLTTTTTVDDAMANTTTFGRAAGVLAVLWHLENRNGNRHNSSINNNSNKTPWSSHWGSWRMGGILGRAQRELVMSDGASVLCTCHQDGSYDLSWTTPTAAPSNDDATTTTIKVHVDGYYTTNEEHRMLMIVDGSKHIWMNTVLQADDATGIFHVRMWPENGGGYQNGSVSWSLDVVNPLSPASVVSSAATVGSSSSSGIVQAPMPGKISRIHYAVGDTVQAGDVVVVLEAMKMEHACSSPCSGIVSELYYQPKDVVEEGAALFLISEQQQESEVKPVEGSG